MEEVNAKFEKMWNCQVNTWGMAGDSFFKFQV